MQIQSVLFNKKDYTLSQAFNYVLSHPDLKIIKAPRSTEHYWRFRQEKPDYNKYDYRTIKHKNIKYIVGYPKHK
jgi:hypothetical protein